MGEVFFWVINLTVSGVGAFFLYHLKYFLISCINLTGSSAAEWCRGILLILLNAFSIVLFVSHLRRQKYECLMGRSVTPSGLRRRVKLCLCVYACVFLCVCVYVRVVQWVVLCLCARARKEWRKAPWGRGYIGSAWSCFDLKDPVSFYTNLYIGKREVGLFRVQPWWRWSVWSSPPCFDWFFHLNYNKLPHEW